MTSIFEDALLATAAYRRSSSENQRENGEWAHEELRKLGWRHLGKLTSYLEENDVESAKESGLAGEVYQSSVGQIVIASRGTEFGLLKESIKDYKTDVILGTGLDSEQAELMKPLISKVAEIERTRNIHLVGHSLGGNLSQEGKHSIEGIYDPVLDDIKLTVSGFNDPGAGRIDHLQTDGQALSVRDRGDFISLFGGDKIGEVLTVDGPGDLSKGLLAPHDMRTLVEYLGAQRWARELSMQDLVNSSTLRERIQQTEIEAGKLRSTTNRIYSQIQRLENNPPSDENVKLIAEDIENLKVLAAQYQTRINELRADLDAYVEAFRSSDSSVDNEGGGQGNGITVNRPDVASDDNVSLGQQFNTAPGLPQQDQLAAVSEQIRSALINNAPAIAELMKPILLQANQQALLDSINNLNHNPAAATPAMSKQKTVNQNIHVETQAQVLSTPTAESYNIEYAVA